MKAAIAVTNVGVKPLHLTARGECSCAQATATKKTLEPGESGEIELTFHTYTFVGKLTKHVTVTSDDPDQNTVRVEVHVDVSAGILVEPANFFFNAALVGASPTSTVKVKKRSGGAGATTFRILDVKAKGVGVDDVRFDTSAFTEGAFAGYEVTMRFGHPPPIGPVSGEAVITTDDAEAPTLKCLVGGMISDRVFISQRETSIGVPEEGKEVVLRIGCRAFDDTVKLGSVTAKARKGVVRAAVERDANDPKGWTILITLPGSTPVGAVEDVVEVTTDVAGSEHATIKVTGTVVAKPAR